MKKTVLRLRDGDTLQMEDPILSHELWLVWFGGSESMHAVVYTAIFGDYDALQEPVQQDESCDFICFTDTRMPSQVGAWRVIHVKRNGQLHPRMQAKRFKLLSHRIFPDGRLAFRYAPFSLRRRFDLSIWVDANIRIKGSSFVRDMRAALDGRDWAMCPHPDRDCIYDEAQISATLVKYQGLPILPQVEAYRSVVPPHRGLYACRIITRHEPTTECVRKVNELWWEENLKWTYQDQLSLPFVLQLVTGCNPAKILVPQRRNQWFKMTSHNRNT